MLRIPLAEDLAAIIDDADELLVAGFRWRPLVLKNATYAHAWNGRQHYYMHRLIAGCGPKDRVDHRNRDGLDNRRLNLRVATPSQNGANRIADKRKAGTTSDYKGVFWDKARSRWTATIHYDGKTHSLGRHGTEEEAAVAYDRAAIAKWGRFARLNLP